MNRTACLIERRVIIILLWGRREGELHSKELVAAVGKDGGEMILSFKRGVDKKNPLDTETT